MNRKFGNAVLWIMAIGYYFLIISFSTTPALKSKTESQAIVSIIENLGDGVLKKPGNSDVPLIPRKVLHKIVRKSAHILNFFILAFLHAMLVFSYSRKRLITVSLTFGMGFCGAVIDEITQSFIKGRSSQISDVCVDLAGTIFGCILFLYLCRIIVSDLERRC